MFGVPKFPARRRSPLLFLMPSRPSGSSARIPCSWYKRPISISLPSSTQILVSAGPSSSGAAIRSEGSSTTSLTDPTQKWRMSTLPEMLTGGSPGFAVSGASLQGMEVSPV